MKCPSCGVEIDNKTVLSEVMRELGKKKSPRKAESSKANGKKHIKKEISK